MNLRIKKLHVKNSFTNSMIDDQIYRYEQENKDGESQIH